MPVARTATAAKKTASPRAKKAALPGPYVFEAEFDRETTGTLKFSELGEKEDLIARTLYLTKVALGDAKPAKVRVTVEVLSVQD
jgi:hypothetical protein